MISFLLLSFLAVLLLLAGCSSQSQLAVAPTEGAAAQCELQSSDAGGVQSLAAADALGGAIFAPEASIAQTAGAVAAND